MKARQTIKCIYAWTLIAVFTSVLALKAVHFHDTSYHGQASVGQLCSVCEFTMHEAAAVKTTVFVPITVVKWIVRPIKSEQIVYQTVASVNSHSPPTVG